ncbi:ParB-like partition protein [Hoeflea phototrophica DFL-43]|jgi:ParB family chromosome partitioning protein|uniref:ParB-like partition protein n=1 Tax=Hoeflea phototrophica (strain DSM 17068 / NCIMB 14078 / DFL-43) TaxID=411684 RepID=A9D2T6_HOEPD|nr:ParB/RepB/Spo0J family partition protein [Hoeflea phototrophica]EDQ34270.1 ParB-like partition protein [Hoeflea phototrophica DFL-43]
MAISKSIPLENILVPDRLRAVDEDHALAISKSIAEHGLMNPVTIRQTPNGARTYTLVAGAHRLRGIELLKRDKVDAIVVKADANEAVLLEIAENLFRNDLSVMDRAVFVQTYRDIWQKTRGEIKRGNPQLSNSAKFAQLGNSPVDLIAQGTANGFSEVCADRLGMSRRAIYLLNTIAQNLPRELRQEIAGTRIANHQSQLLKLAKLEPSKRAKAHIAIRETKGDFKAAIDLLEPPAKKPDPELQILSRLIDAWERAKPATRKKFLAHAGLAATAKGGQS